MGEMDQRASWRVGVAPGGKGVDGREEVDDSDVGCCEVENKEGSVGGEK